MRPERVETMSDVRAPWRTVFVIAWAASAILATSSSGALAADPALGAIVPYGGQRGSELEVQFQGARLGDAQQILIYEPGIEVVSLEPAGDNAVKTKLRLLPECRLGAIPMRVRTASGLSNLRTFSVGALKEIVEAEPNSEFAKPQAIELDTCVNGFVDNEDVDYYLVNAKKGERITAEIEGIRLGNTFFDPYVAIMNLERFELANSDDSSLVWQDAVVSLLAPEDGQYIVQVRESAFGGSGACTYRLHVGRFPRPTAVVPAGGRPGETLSVTWLGDVLGPRTEQVTLPAELKPNFGLIAKDELGLSPSANVFRVGDLENTLEIEPNNGVPEATPFTAPRALGGVIGTAGDTDHYVFHATKGQVFDVRVLARALRTSLDPVVSVYRKNGPAVAANDDSGGPDAYVRFTAPEDDDYVIILQDHLGKGGADYAYRIEVAPVKPVLVMGLPERQQFVDITVAVPRNNRTAFLVSASRQDFGGELQVGIDGLPAGIKQETVAMAANQSLVPVVLEAAADAPLAGALADVTGKLNDPNQAISGRLNQMTSMVRGQNNIHVWVVNTDRMAVAVTEECPFKIEIVEPKVPLVRNGVMNLKVVATRKEGFTAPISLQMLYNPPGVGSSGGIAIAEGQKEALIPLNASSDAEIKAWKIAVLGVATVGNGAVWVSSQLANLEVADQYFQFAFQATAVEKGKETEVVVNVTKGKDFAGPAKVELLGLPNEVTSEPLEFNQDATQVVFKLKTTGNSPVGKHPTLLCRAIVTAQDEPITHMLGTGELRIDEPLPPKPMETAAAPPMPMPTPMAEKPPEKRLTLLEKLRLERKQAKEQAAQAAQSPQETKPAEAVAGEGSGN
jgi:hypothetical protein